MSTNLYKIKFYGIGGQGVVTATNILCNAACLYDNKYGKTQPSYGHERRGAPVVSDLYIDDKPIQIASFIYKPNVVVLLDPHIKDKGIDITEGIQPDTILVINSNYGTTIYHESFKDIYVLNATKLSLEYFKVDIPNIPMLGAFAKTGIVKLSSIEQTIIDNFKQEPNNANIEILNEAYGKTKKI